jgi:hypothetical protein
MSTKNVIKYWQKIAFFAKKEAKNAKFEEYPHEGMIKTCGYSV